MALSNSQHPFQPKQDSSLWTPDGNVPVGRHVQAATEGQMKTLTDMHDVAHQFGHIAVICLKCDKSFHGQNQGNGRMASISCGCREIRYVSERRIV